MDMKSVFVGVVAFIVFGIFAMAVGERYGWLTPVGGQNGVGVVRQFQGLVLGRQQTAADTACNPRSLGSPELGREWWGVGGVRYNMSPRPGPASCLVVEGNRAHWN